MAGQVLFHTQEVSWSEVSFLCMYPARAKEFLSLSPDPIRTPATINTHDKQQITSSVPSSLLILTFPDLNASDFGCLEFLASFYSLVSNESDEFSGIR